MRYNSPIIGNYVGYNAKMKESAAARQVAHDVLESLGKGIKPNITELAIKRGYSPKSAAHGAVTSRKSYKKVISSFVDKLEVERQRAVDAMAGKISKAKYRDLTDAIDKLTKNHQLLTGGATANLAVGVKKLKDDELERIAEGG